MRRRLDGRIDEEYDEDDDPGGYIYLGSQEWGEGFPAVPIVEWWKKTTCQPEIRLYIADHDIRQYDAHCMSLSHRNPHTYTRTFRRTHMLKLTQHHHKASSNQRLRKFVCLATQL